MADDVFAFISTSLPRQAKPKAEPKEAPKPEVRERVGPPQLRALRVWVHMFEGWQRIDHGVSMAVR